MLFHSSINAFLSCARVAGGFRRFLTLLSSSSHMCSIGVTPYNWFTLISQSLDMLGSYVELIIIMWAASSENMPLIMRKMGRSTSICTCGNSHPRICSTLKYCIVSNDSVCERLWHWSDCVDVRVIGPLLSAYARKHDFTWRGPCEIDYFVTLHYCQCPSSVVRHQQFALNYNSSYTYFSQTSQECWLCVRGRGAALYKWKRL